MPQKYNLLQGMGVGKNQHPFTVSNTSELVDDSQKTAQEILRETLGKEPDINDETGLSTIIGDRPIPDLKMTAKEAETYYDNDVIPNPYVDRDVLDKARAKNQGVLAKTGNMLAQAVINEVLIGTIKGFSDLFDAAASIGKMENNDYSNAVSAELERWQDSVRDYFAIYQKYNDGGFHLDDYGWWMNGAVSAATTLSLMIPAAGTAKGISLLGKIGGIGNKLGKLSRQAIRATKLANTGRIYHTAKGIAEIGGMAFLSRTAENYQEARETYKNILDTTKQKLANFTPEQRERFLNLNPQFKDKSDEEIADGIASSSAFQTFKNDYWMLLMDIPQFKTLSSIYKGAGIASKATTKAVRQANRRAVEKLIGQGMAETEAKATAKSFGKKILDGFKFENIGTGVKNLWKSTEGLMLGEGIEEGFQGIQSQRGEEYGELYFNPYLQRKTLGDYLQDETIWEQAFWGVMGGLLFQGVAKGFNKLENRIRAKVKEDDLSKDQIELLKAGEDAGRVANINSWFTSMEEYKEDMDKISRGINIYSPKVDERGQVILDSNKNVVYNQLESPAEIERLKTVRTNDYLTRFTIDAINNGNYDLLKEFVSNKEFNKYFQDAGVDIDEVLEGQFINKMQEVYDLYSKAYYDVIDNTDAYNDHITRLAALDVVHKELDLEEARRRIDNLNEYIDSEGLNNKPYYEKLVKQQVIRYKLDEIDKAINRVKENYKKNDFYSKQAYDKELKNLQDQKDYLYKLLEASDDNFKYSEIKGKDIEETLQEASKAYNKFIEDNNLLDETPINKLSDSLRESLYQKAAFEVYRDELLNDLPESNNTKDYYKKLYEQKEATLVDIASSKFTDALNVVQDYIKKSKNLDVALNNLLKDGINSDTSLTDRQKGRLNNALELLRFGSEDRLSFTAALAKYVMQEQQKRNKLAEEESKIVVDDKEVKAEPEVKENVSTDSSTGETKEEEVEDTSKVTAEEETDEKPTPIEEEIIKKQAQDIKQDQLRENKDRSVLRIANEVAYALKNKNRELWGQVIKDGAGSQAYNSFISLMIDEMTVGQGVTPIIAEKYVQQGLKLHLENEYYRTKNIAKDKAEKVKALLDSINKVNGFDSNGNSSYEGMDEKQAANAKHEFVRDSLIAFAEESNAKSIDIREGKSKIVIDARQMFQYLTTLYDNDKRDYIDLLYLYKDIAYYLQYGMQNDKEFTDKYEILNINDFSLDYDAFMDKLYKSKTKEVVTNPFMHFSSTLNSKTNTSIEDYNNSQLIRIVQQARNKPVEINITKTSNGTPVSISFTYQGVELGKLALVKANKTNTGFTAIYNGEVFDIELGLDGKYNSKAISFYKSLLNNDELYYLLAEDFYNKNGYLFYGSNLELQQAVKNKAPGKTIKEKAKAKKDFLKRDEVVNFIQRNKITIEEESEDGEETVKLNLNEMTSSQIKDKIDSLSSAQFSKLFNIVANKINKVLFYDLTRKDVTYTEDDRLADLLLKRGLETSIDRFQAKVYENFKSTKELQDKIEKTGKPVTAILRGDDVGEIRYSKEKEKGTNKLEIKDNIQDYPVIYFDGSRGIDENGKVYRNIPGLGKNGDSTGVMAILLGTNQGRNQISTDSTIENTPGANIAILTSSNTLDSNPEARKLKLATKKYIRSLFDEFYSIVNSNAGFDAKNAAFENLYQNLKALFGNSETKLFTGFIVDKHGNNIIHIRRQVEANKFATVATIFKYDKNTSISNGQIIDSSTGNPIPDNELSSRIKGGTILNRGKKEVTIYDTNSQKSSDYLDSTLDYITNQMVFNRTRFAIGPASRQQGKHIYKDSESGKIVIEVGDFKQEYNSYSSAIVALNMFNTNQVGRKGYWYEYKTGATYRLPNSFYLEITGEQAPITDEQMALEKGLYKYMMDNRLADGAPVDTYDVLKAVKTNKDTLTKIMAFNESLKEETGTGLFSDKVLLNYALFAKDEYGNLIDSRADASWHNGNVVITRKGVLTTSFKTPAQQKEFILRLLIHENVHRLSDETKFFEGDIGTERVIEINKIFNDFVTALQGFKPTDSKGRTLKRYLTNKFLEKGQFKDELWVEGELNNRSLAEEFLSEVISDNYLRDFLNTVQTKEEVIVNNEVQKKTLLQRVLDFILDLFGIKVNNNTLLAEFYNTLNSIKTANLADSSVLAPIGETGVAETSPVKEIDTTIVPEDDFIKQIESEIQSLQLGDDEDTINLDRDSRYDGWSADEVIFEDIDKDSNVDIFAVTKIPDMNAFIQTVPSSQRSAVASNLANNEVEYLCR